MSRLPYKPVTPNEFKVLSRLVFHKSLTALSLARVLEAAGELRGLGRVLGGSPDHKARNDAYIASKVERSLTSLQYKSYIEWSFRGADRVWNITDSGRSAYDRYRGAQLKNGWKRVTPKTSRSKLLILELDDGGLLISKLTDNAIYWHEWIGDR